MTPDDPRHGEYRGYQQHIRDGEKPSEVCPPCHEASRRYQRVRPHLHALGKPPRVPVGEVAYRNFVTLAARMTVTEIETATGISDSQISNVLKNGPTANTLRRTRAKYEAIDVAAILDAHLSHIGTVRRVQALHAIGYTTGQLARETGMCSDALVTLRERAKWSSATTRRKVADAYERLHMKPQRRRDKYAARFYNLAAANGWLPPLMWDDIDDENEQPKVCKMERTRDEIDHAVVERILAGDTLPATRAERQEVMRRWIARGWPTNELERRTGWKVERYGRKGAA